MNDSRRIPLGRPASQTGPLSSHVLATRRGVLRSLPLAAAGLAGAPGFDFLAGLAPVSAQEARLEPGAVRFAPAIEPVVRLLEDTPRDRLLEEVGQRVRSGKLSYREVVAALQLAGVRNIQPRPVGFKFHAVLVVNSAHIASIASPDSERWLPIFWALDYFKSSQQRDIEQGDWTMREVEESSVPRAHRAEAAFIEAMENWDVSAADAAAAGLARAAGAHRVFEILARFGARDFRDIGHKAIFVSNAWRLLQSIGWEHAELVVRSLAYALLAHEGDNPARRDAPADRPWRENHDLAGQIPDGWLDGRHDPDAAASLLPILRDGSASDAASHVVKLLRDGVGPASLWDALLGFSGELMMRRGDILALHAVTTGNAMFYAFRTIGDDMTRRMLLLQNASFLPLFRRDPEEIANSPHRIDEIAPVDLPGDDAAALDAVFEAVSSDRAKAASMTLAFCRSDPARAEAFIDRARQLLFFKGDNTHDYKFTSAVLEDYSHLTPSARDAFLASSVFNLRGSNDPDNALIERVRGALG